MSTPLVADKPSVNLESNALSINTLSDLMDATEFERFALASAVPPATSNACLDIRHQVPATRIHAFSVAVTGQPEIEAAISRYRPLLFGAAWKCLDLAIELGLHNGGIGPDRNQQYSIELKQKKAACAELPPLNSDPALRVRLAELYRKTVEVRHCLIHRRFRVNSAGDMTDLHDKNGQRLPDFRAIEQLAFVRAVGHALDAISTGAPDQRTTDLLIYQLDQLSSVHGHAALGGGSQRPLQHQIQIAAAVGSDGQWTVDIDAALAALHSAWPHAKHANVLITPAGADDAPPLIGRLEEAQSGNAVVFDPTAPPSWMRP